MKLSSHFTLSEMTRSDAATRYGLVNSAPLDAIERMKALCQHILEPARTHFGPIYINSGYRSLEVNKLIGGAKTSQHMKGEAADIESEKTTNFELARWIADNCPYDQVILEYYKEGDPRAGWVHVSYSDKNRRELLTFDGKAYTKGLLP